MKIEEGQNIIDIAIQEYGSFEAVFQLLLDNLLLENMNVFLEGETELLISKTALDENVVIKNEYKKRNYRVRTGDEFIPILTQDYDKNDYETEDYF
ncbi:MAG: hypothetical protein COZ16_05600 [Flavobacteriaceae bacterium CG_4_10_14_3_um_filter_31_253]|nr:MAG: hypothetical protein COZ16_05600 [Flavobacteriaceae bacterium CG_4_10_14_3_um_filter_31_253]